MRILVYSQHFWPENFRINELVMSLNELGCDVEVLTGKPNYPEGIFFKGYENHLSFIEIWNGITIHRLPMLPRKNSNSLNLFLNYFSFFLSSFFFAPFFLRNKKYDIIFVYGTSPIYQAIPARFLGAIKKCKTVLWVQDLWPESAEATGHVKSKIILYVMKLFVKFTYLLMDHILVQSRGFILPIKSIAKNKPVSYFPNSVDKFFSNNFKIPPRVSSIDSLKGGFKVVFAGNIGKGQSIETILDAAELLKDHTDVKIIFFGGGSLLNWLCNEQRKRNLSNVFIEGRYPFDQMPSILSEASVLLVSLLDRPIFNLTVPSKIQAYMAVGKPIIASLNGEGARIIAESGSGICVPAENSEKLFEAIVKLKKKKKDELKKIGKLGNVYFEENFNELVLTKKLIRIFKALLSKRKN